MKLTPEFKAQLLEKMVDLEYAEWTTLRASIKSFHLANVRTKVRKTLDLIEEELEKI